MYEYFEGNYTWNMAVCLALGMGAAIGDIDDVSRPLRAVARNNDDAAAEMWFAAWGGLGRKLRRLAEADEAKGRKLSAGEKYRRAAIYLVQAERMQRPGFEPREKTFAEYLECFAKFVALTGQNCERVAVPYKGKNLPALLIKAEGVPAGQRAPAMVHFDGLDVTKEIIFMLGIPQALARRGVSTLVVDNPGVGESLRLLGLHNGPDAEVPGGACIDFLEKRPGIDAKRIGIMALSLGGFHAPRVAAFEPRTACAVAWGAQYDWGDTQRMRAANKNASLPVPHYWDHVGWVFGIDGHDIDAIVAASSKISLHGILDRITCPIIVIHGENDRQIPLAYAQRVVAECVNSKKAELHIMKLADGGAEHCGIDNVAPTREVMADWIAETLGGRLGV